MQEEKGILQSNDSESPPAEINSKSVIYWSAHYKMLKGVEGGNARRTKARIFIKKELIEYDKEKKCYICKPIKGYNKTTYNLIWDKTKPKYNGEGYGDFECSCQFNQTTKKICSHILALYMMLKIWNWNKRNANQN